MRNAELTVRSKTNAEYGASSRGQDRHASAIGQLIEAQDLDGPMNMAIDELLWRAVGSGQVFFRLYGWAGGPTISLGYFQSSREVRGVPRWSGVPVVRRMTGGGAIVHDRDLTYSMSLPAWRVPTAEWLYERFHRAVAAELRTIGIAASLEVSSAADDHRAILCFQRRDRYAVCLGPCKILGSAQRRRAGSVLMHGSLALCTSPFAPELSGLDRLATPAPDPSRVRHTLVRAAQTALDIELRSSVLAADLVRRAVQLAGEKYRTSAWNDRR